MARRMPGQRSSSAPPRRCWWPAAARAAGAAAQVPAVNAVIDGDEIVYRDYTDISIAVATPKGLVVPVLRNADELSFADVEKARPARAGL